MSYSLTGKLLVRLGVELNKQQVEYWVGYALLHGYKREEPRSQKPWRETERREALRFAIKHMVQSKGASDG